MIQLHELKPSQKRFHPKRVGRGNASGKGTTAGRGTKGQRARTGGRNKLTRRSMRHLFERVAKKRGFTSRRLTVETLDVKTLQGKFPDGSIISRADLVKAGLVSRRPFRVKIIGSGPIAKKLIVKADAFSKAAAAAITAAKGQAVTVQAAPAKEQADA